jgi:hypothetical protein
MEIQVLKKINIESKLNYTIWTISTTVAAIVLAILTNSPTPELFNSYKTAIPTVLTIVILAAIIGLFTEHYITQKTQNKN